MRPSIVIQDREIGAEHPTYFIADIAASHDGDLEKAKDLIYSAAEKGADAAKFQNFQAATIVSDYGFRSLGSQKSHQARWEKSVYEVYEAASLPLDWTPILKETCDRAGIHYFTSPYSPQLTKAVAPYVAAWKMGSGDITWHEQIEAMCADGKPIMIATGAATMDDVERAVQVLRRFHTHYVLMQCNTNYTARLNETREERNARFACINLRVLQTYQNSFPEAVLGLSDHTHGADTVLGAVGLFDARVVEKHYTLDNNAEGPDHPFSMNPQTWQDMVERTRALEGALTGGMTFEQRLQKLRKFVDDPEALELSLGDGIKRVEENEQETVVLQRRAPRATRPLKQGDVLVLTDFYPLRPAPRDCIAPYEMKSFTGRVLKRDIPEGDYFREDDFV